MSKKIIICENCEGEGLVHLSKLVDYHHGDYDEWTEKCQDCNGSGRMLEEIKITTVAYVQKRAKTRE